MRRSGLGSPKRMLIVSLPGIWKATALEDDRSALRQGDIHEEYLVILPRSEYYGRT